MRRAKKVPKMPPKLDFSGFDINLINSYVLFLLKYESANGLLTFFEDHNEFVLEKNLVHEL